MKDLWKIYRLQAYEKELISLKAGLKSLDPGKELKCKKEDLSGKLNSKKDKLSGNKKRIKDITYESEEIDSQIKSVEDKLKTMHHKQVPSWKLKLNKLKERREAFDEENLTLMYENEELEGAVEKASKDYSKVEEEYNSYFLVYRRDIEELEARIEDIENKEARIRETLEADLLTLFEECKARYGGIAIVPLQRNICGGCGMTISGMLAERAKSRMSIQYCEHCGRILYWEGGG